MNGAKSDPKAFVIRQARLETYFELRETDRKLIARVVDGFVPDQVFDIHTHLFRDSDYDASARPIYSQPGLLRDAASLRKGLECWMPGREIRALAFGIAKTKMDHLSMNKWVGDEVAAQPGWRALALARPTDDPQQIEALLASGKFSGLKVYHTFTGRSDSFNCSLEEFAPEWMWDILNKHRGILMLHVVRDKAMDDVKNQAAARHLCRKYPNCQVVFAHVARSFSHRTAFGGLRFLRDFDNAWVDTSAVCEGQAMAAALKILGPERVLYGSDFPVSNFRGRSMALGDTFHWIYEDLANEDRAVINSQLALVGLESLAALREAAEDTGMNQGDLEGIFSGNAERLLGMKTQEAPDWDKTREHISCGTGLLSKRKEQFDPVNWPTFFSRCKGAEVWDATGRRFVDFAGGVGAILLGYNDETVDAALNRRISAGTYCTLVNPEEDKLASLLLRLHPWAGRVRFARGGGEAMTMAVRIARAATGRSGVAFCGYHGWHDWYLAANLSDDSALDGHLLPGLQPLGVPRELKGTSAPFRYNDLESLKTAIAALGGKPAAIVMEPMRSQWPEKDFLVEAKRLAEEAGAIFILDEVTSGFRYGFPGAHTRLGVEPHIAVYAKALSNGIPCAAVIGRADIMDAANASFISSSYWTDSLGTAAALACVQKIEKDNIFEEVWAKGEAFQGRLRAVAAAHPACKLSIGSMPSTPSLVFGLGELNGSAKVFLIRGLLESGILGSLQIYLMNAHTAGQMDDYLQAVDEVLSELETAIAKGELAATLGTASTFARLA